MLVRGASRLASSFGLSPIVVGLTVVAWGTSSPELAVTVRASLAGQGDLSLGNVVGSNICNTLLITGLCSVAMPLAVSRRVRKWDARVMIFASLLIVGLALDGNLSRLDGIVLVTAAVTYTVVTILISRGPVEAEVEKSSKYVFVSPKIDNILSILAGLIMLIAGAQWIVDGAVSLATSLGVSELVVGLTVVAIGTSLPEIAASFVASVRGHREIAVGNVVGSNIYNILLVLGTAALLTRGGIAVSDSALRVDMPIMLGAALICVPVFYSSGGVTRWEGVLFLGHYAAYTVFLILKSQGSTALTAFKWTMLALVIPLSVIALLVHSFRHFQGDELADDLRPEAQKNSR